MGYPSRAAENGNFKKVLEKWLGKLYNIIGYAVKGMEHKMGRVLVIIPAYNKEGNIEQAVSDLRGNYPSNDYIVINDGSRDYTPEILDGSGFEHIAMPINEGLARGVQTGMMYAYSHGYSYAVQYDGDGQHAAYYIEEMIKTMEYCDICIGSRFVDKKDQIRCECSGAGKLTSVYDLQTNWKGVPDQTPLCFYEDYRRNIGSPELDAAQWLKHMKGCGYAWMECADPISIDLYAVNEYLADSTGDFNILYITSADKRSNQMVKSVDTYLTLGKGRHISAVAPGNISAQKLEQNGYTLGRSGAYQYSYKL